MGFALIFKASGVFNFAQGAMVLFAALAVARLSERMPLWAAILLGIVIMIALAFVIERVVLRPLVNQEAIALFMATLGVTFFLDGFGQTVWGSDIYKIDLGIAKEPVMVLERLFQGGILINKEDVVATLVAVALVVPPDIFSIPPSMRSMTESRRASSVPKFSTTPSTVVRMTSRSAGSSAATSAESLSLSPNFSSVTETASFSLMMGITPCFNSVTKVWRALRWRSWCSRSS